MNKTSNRYYNDRRPSISVRVSPETKAELMKMKEENGMTLSDVTAEVINNGLNNHLNSNPQNNSISVDGNARQELEQFDGYIQGIKDKAYDMGFLEASKKSVEDINGLTRSQFIDLFPNSILAKELKDGEEGEDEEEIFECPSCGEDIEGGEDVTICPECGASIKWVEEGEEEGILSGLFKWNNGG